MKISEFLKQNKIEKTPDVLFALSHVTGFSRSIVLFCDIDKKQEKAFLKIHRKLKKGMPLDLILGHSIFFGRKFLVNKNVLKPRTDTEFVCEQALKHIKSSHSVLDLCCGSGVLGITIAKEKLCDVTLCDISAKSLSICKKNAKLNNAQCKITKSDLFSKVNGTFDVIVSNPPYIKTGDIKTLDDSVKKFDPKIALDGGADGLYFYRKIIDQAPHFLKENGKLIFEIGYNQKDDVLKLMKKNFDAVCEKDYNQKDRIIIGELKNGKTRKNDK